MDISVRPAKLLHTNFGGHEVLHCIPGTARFPFPLLFQHGMFSKAQFFSETMLRLGDRGYESYAFTLKDHGNSESSENKGSVSIADHVSDLTFFALSLQQRPIMIGHAMGAIIAYQVAKEVPTAGFISLMSAPPRGVLMGTGMMVRIFPYLTAMLQRKPFSFSKDHCRDLLFNTLDSEDFERYASDLGEESGLAALEISVWKYGMAKLPCPTLVVGARFDKITPNQESVAQLLCAELCEINTCHMAMMDPNRAELVEVIDKWLKVQHCGIRLQAA